jgi:hypothetical protein
LSVVVTIVVAWGWVGAQDDPRERVVVVFDGPFGKPFGRVPYGEPKDGDACRMHYEHLDAAAVSVGKTMTLRDSLRRMSAEIGRSTLHDPERQTAWDVEVSFGLDEAEALVSDVAVVEYGILCPVFWTVPGRAIVRPRGSEFEYRGAARYTSGRVTIALPRVILSEFSEIPRCSAEEVTAYALIEWHPLPDAVGAMRVEARCHAPRKPLVLARFPF